MQLKQFYISFLKSYFGQRCKRINYNNQLSQAFHPNSAREMSYVRKLHAKKNEKVSSCGEIKKKHKTINELNTIRGAEGQSGQKKTTEN